MTRCRSVMLGVLVLGFGGVGMTGACGAPVDPGVTPTDTPTECTAEVETPCKRFRIELQGDPNNNIETRKRYKNAFKSACYMSADINSTFNCFYRKVEGKVMVERQHYYGRLVFDRDAIVRAALRAYVETNLANLDPLERHRFAVAFRAIWMGDLRRGAFYNDDACGSYEIVAWTEAGVVGLAYDLGSGPIEQLGLEIEEVTGGPDDVRGAVPELPEELDPAFLMAVGMLATGAGHLNHDGVYVVYGEKLAGVGFWLHGDRVGGSFFLFTDPTLAWGATRLAAWGLLRNGRLPDVTWGRDTATLAAQPDASDAAPIHAIIDAVTARALVGPTELTPDELATLCPTPPDSEKLLAVQRRLQKVGITWPGSPEILA